METIKRTISLRPLTVWLLKELLKHNLEEVHIELFKR